MTLGMSLINKEVYALKIHIVKKGDTLYELSKKYNVDLNKIIEMNPQIADPNVIDVGDKIKIPTAPSSIGMNNLPKKAWDKATKKMEETKIKITEPIKKIEPIKSITPNTPKTSKTEDKKEDLFEQFKVPAKKVGSLYDMPTLPEFEESPVIKTPSNQAPFDAPLGKTQTHTKYPNENMSAGAHSNMMPYPNMPAGMQGHSLPYTNMATSVHGQMSAYPNMSSGMPNHLHPYYGNPTMGHKLPCSCSPYTHAPYTHMPMNMPANIHANMSSPVFANMPANMPAPPAQVNPLNENVEAEMTIEKANKTKPDSNKKKLTIKSKTKVKKTPKKILKEKDGSPWINK